MLSTIIKALATAAFIAVMSEVAKRSTLLAAIMIGLPLATILTVAFTASDKDIATANQFANSTFFMIWPGVTFFIVLPLAQKLGASFWVAFGLAVATVAIATGAFIAAYKAMGVKL